ncbi:transposon Ty3-I Gag-Pol polyprotein [Trichonephila inaurata madagascariensis]|uniref:Transposon Ty3-I Gag-Pol polyprotein n=1 Tax=Trichonephila inaurata madagascariensis TaxID=2747483 RepID=A0A8X6X5I3_9ARAC|nr:transposon Ty3-I Gag-Pol polyprotein [Trichonephila inaurata madagascariensis]
MDLLGRFPKSQGGNRWIIVCTDYIKRYAITKALPTAEAPEVARFFVEEIILTHGAPRTIITDTGIVFKSNLIAEINNQCKVVHWMTTAYHPQTNGLTESFNKTLADMLAMYVDVEQKMWDQILLFVTFAYNTARQDTTGFTPFFLTFGREAETTLDAMFQGPIEYTAPDFVAQLVTQAEESRQLARIRTLEAQEKDQCRCNSRHHAVLYQPGDLVWIYILVCKVGHSKKLLKKMKPYYDPDLQAHLNDSMASDDRRFGESTPSTGRNDYTGPTTRSRPKALRQTH